MNPQIHYYEVAPHIRFVNDLKKHGYLDFNERVIYDNELIFCVDGSAKVLMENETYVLNRGDFFYLRPGVKSRMIIDEDKFFHAHCVHFDWCRLPDQPDFKAEEVYYFPPTTPEEIAFAEKLSKRDNAEVVEFSFFPLIRGVDYEKVLPLFRGMFNCYRSEAIADDVKMRGLFLEIVAEMMMTKEPTYSSTEKAHRLMVDRAMEYINVHYKESISVPMLADLSGMSDKYFGVLFKRVTGLTVNEYILQVRMQRTEELLLKTSMPLSEIADEVGIGDEYYIVKLFKRYKGITPGRYRRMVLYKIDQPR